MCFISYNRLSHTLWEADITSLSALHGLRSRWPSRHFSLISPRHVDCARRGTPSITPHMLRRKIVPAMSPMDVHLLIYLSFWKNAVCARISKVTPHRSHMPYAPRQDSQPYTSLTSSRVTVGHVQLSPLIEALSRKSKFPYILFIRNTWKWPNHLKQETSLNIEKLMSTYCYYGNSPLFITNMIKSWTRLDQIYRLIL